MKPESGDRAILTHERGKGYVWESAWSRDGTQIYFVRTSACLSSIYRIPVLGGEERLLLENAFGPAALPDGSLLVTRSTGANRAQLCRFWPDTGKVRDFPISIVVVNGRFIGPFRMASRLSRTVCHCPSPQGPRPISIWWIWTRSRSGRFARAPLPAGSGRSHSRAMAAPSCSPLRMRVSCG